MKVIACTQCGALIKDISNWSFSVKCSYCGATYITPQLSEKTFDVEKEDFKEKSKRSRARFLKLNEHMSKKGNAITWRSQFSRESDSKNAPHKIVSGERISNKLIIDRVVTAILLLVLLALLFWGFYT